MNDALVYIHGKGGSADECAHYRPLFPERDVIGFDYGAGTPWEAKEEFTAYFADLSRAYGDVTLVANSIGAYFAMQAEVGAHIRRAYFISPVVDMEKLILDMLTWAGVTEDDLRREKTIQTTFGEVLSWEYLSYVRAHPVRWTVPTRILCGEKDRLTSPETVRAFARSIGAPLSVMAGGEHWFHTPAEMDFLDAWITSDQR